MIELVTQKREGIAELCRRLGVRRLEVFGSAARGTFTPETSDLDFLYEFSGEANYLNRFLDLAESLETLLGKKVDLLNFSSIRNPYLRESIERDKELVYGT